MQRHEVKTKEIQKKDHLLDAVESAIVVDDAVPPAAADCGPASWHADAIGQTLALGLILKALGLFLIATLLFASKVADLFLAALLLEAQAAELVDELGLAVNDLDLGSLVGR